MPRPRTVHDLWKEYQFGGPGRKAVKDSTPIETLKVMSIYSMRMPLWDKVEELVRNGVTLRLPATGFMKQHTARA